MRILMMAHRSDAHADTLQQQLEARGATVSWLDVSQIPHTVWAHLALDTTGTHLRLPDGGCGDDITAVYYRRMSSVRRLGVWDHLPPQEREFAALQAEATLVGLSYSLADRPWINPALSRELHANKPAGLMLARRVGMTIPDTLFSNDPEAVLAFCDKHDGQIVFKSAAVGTLHMDERSAKVLYTTRIARPQIVDHPDLIRATPGLFQAEVPKARELRVTYIDGEIFCAEVISGDPSLVDWRVTISNGLRSVRAELPTGLDAKIHAFMQAMGLRYGAFDFIITPDDEVVFLEVNPQGAYLWLEKELGFPITAAIADALLLKG